MAAQRHSVRRRPVPATMVQQSSLQPAEAPSATQIDLASPMTQDPALHDIDLATPDSDNDALPPPAYGEVHGEIRSEKDGVGTSARVTDDGRVDIRINQLNRRLSQIFIPALRQQVQKVQETGPAPPPYIPPSLGGDDGTPPPPPLNIVIQVVGSRGDVQPFVALGKVLKTYGHRIRLATHPVFKDFVLENGLEFFSIGGDPSLLMAFMVKNPGLMPGFRTLISGDVGQRKKDIAGYLQGCWRSCYQAGHGMSPPQDDRSESSGDESAVRPFVADCIIANPPSFAHVHCAEKLGIPLHIMFTMPYSPTQAFPHPLANIQASNADPQLTNYISYAMIELLSWQGLGDTINRFRAKCLDLDPVSLIWAPGMLERLKVPHTYCWSPALIPKPKDWGPHISISGFFFLDLATDYTPPADLHAFLDAGPPPVYIGFGSIVLDDPNAMTELIFEAVRMTGQRVLLSKGWGGIGADADDLRIPDGVFMLGNVPHDWLFKHVSCVVHHGGAGTIAAGLAAGRPTLVVPFFGDQPFWGAMVSRAGAGPDPIPHKQLTADKLADAINFCLKPESLERAKELASKIAAERGSEMGALSFHQYLEPDRLRCTLVPSKPAAWRIKRTQVKLSPFAASTLTNASLLNFNDLEPFRPQEYATDEGPWDPVSGGAAAVFGAFSSLVMGLADFPTETWRAVRMPVASSRKQSQAPVPTVAGGSETSRGRERSTPPTSPDQSQTSLDIQEGPSPVRSLLTPSGLPTPMPKPGSYSVSDISQDQTNPRADHAGRSQPPSRNDLDSGKERDLMRRTGAHTSKGFGRMVKTAVAAPMEISVSMTKGFHNAPRLWSDDTVRPQEQVTDMKSGFKAIGKEFGFGMYDGVTGLVTQPWKGARKEGTSGFFKGMGKGIGGFATKPGAALFAIPSYFMKGAWKEVEKMFGGNVQNYIIASRVAQGYEEWRQSTEAERQDVIVRWKLIRKYVKKRQSVDVIRDILEAQRTRDPSGGSLARGGVQSSLRSPTMASEPLPRPTDISERLQQLDQATAPRDSEEDADVMRAIQEAVSQLQSQRQEVSEGPTDHADVPRTLVNHQAEPKRLSSEAADYDGHPTRAVTSSTTEQRLSSDSEPKSTMGLDDEEEEEFERAAAAAGESTGVPRSPPYDSGHLSGTKQSEFEAQQERQHGEKTREEKTEEEIVMEYIKKQSLLELQHRSKGKARATATEDLEDEDLQRALKLSMQGHGSQHGEASAQRSS
ncbi:putative glucosyl/glucuronosyl transferase [Neohortaea acidophila]|uniref:Putative glucosyl/glucuronosyl transferase n=1 Tax=Neohortaea acidophila TaxID=245834 RepID=A0A6A6Q326_9PEZI|nr:putative glucosyl/glucuronosyl transferase [Neohortaea acidophila]KAF2486063.1 putative glucosyl/glucuronosyl transferase [Neohortaea acidophila]